MAAALTVERVGYATVQDLGRAGLGHLGITANGAGDQHAARCANILAGNAETAALVEVVGSELMFRVHRPLLIAVTGAADELSVDGGAAPVWEPVVVWPETHVRISPPQSGLRSYLAINGAIDALRMLGSVAPDRLIGTGTRLASGTTLAVTTRFTDAGQAHYAYLFRLEPKRPRLGSRAEVMITPGPDLARLTRGRAALEEPYVVSPQSDDVGMRLSGAELEQTDTAELLSRGVPVGAVELPPRGGLIVLLRARMLTAGYPVVAVATSTSVDRLAQTRPGDAVAFRFCAVDDGRRQLRAQRDQRSVLTQRVRAAFSSSGLAELITDGDDSTAGNGLSGIRHTNGAQCNAAAVFPSSGT